MNNKDHRKILVVDGKTAFTGGINIADEYINVTTRFGYWKDTGVRIEGKAVWNFTAMFLQMWNFANHSTENYLAYKQQINWKKHYESDGYVQPYADSPIDHENQAENIYLNIINYAKDYVYIFTPYLIIDEEMCVALCNAAKSGVDVRIVTPGIPDKKLIYSITRSFYHNLVQDGVRIYEWTPGFCHAKMSVADDCMATCGTINLDYRSLYHHFENGCFMADCDAVLDIRRDMEQTLEQCREVTEKYKSGRSATLRLGQLFLRLFAELL